MAQMRSADRVRKCLLFGIDRTYRRHVLNDANDPNRTWRSRLLDHLGGARQDRWRDGEAERLGGLEVDHQLERGRLHDWEVSGLGTFEDLPGVNADLTIDGREARPVADQAAGRGEFTDFIDRRNG